MKRVLSMALALLMVFSMIPQLTLGASAVTMTGGEKLYLTPNSNWKQANARFACYFFGSGNTWADMTKVEGETNLYEVTVPSGSWTNVIFCRMNPSTSANNWNNKWNQTGDLVYDGTKNHFTVPSGAWDGSTSVWSTYTPPVPECKHENTTLVYPDGFDCEAGGSVTVYCNDCEENVDTQTVSAGEHSYADNVCTVCGSEKASVEEPVKVDYYLIGFINGADYGCYDDYTNMGEYKFVNGKLTAQFASDSYVFLKTTGNANWYMTESYVEGTTATFKNTTTGAKEKQFVPGGKMLVFTLVENGDDTLTLSYKALELCTVTFDVGVDNVTGAPGSQTLYAGDAVNEPATPTREGYTFGGWYTDVACENEYDFSTVVTGDLILYAKWTKNADEPDTITVYFRNDWLWPEVYVHYWNDTEGTAWPGEKMTFVETLTEGDVYSAEIPTWATSILFNGLENGNDSNRQQTPDIIEGIEDGAAWYIHWDGENKCSKFDYTPAGGEGSETTNTYYLVGYIDNADYNGTDYVFTDGTLEMTFQSNAYVAVKDQTGDWYMTAEYSEDTIETFAKGNEEKMFVAAGSYIFTLVENEDGTLTMSYEASEGEVTENVSYEVTLHFADTLGWGSVNLYTWVGSQNPTGGWPGTAVAQDASGFYSMTFGYEAPAGQGLNFIFSGGGKQTVDLSIPAADFVDNKVEKWIVLTTESDGKYNADILNNGDAIAISPIVNDNTVTFQYKNADAASVAVYGSWDDWSGTTMTKNTYGVWSATIENMPVGIQQYKFVVDGDWITDPCNGWVEDGNSAFLISDPSQDTNSVKIVVNYTRTDGNYEGWNISAWDAPDLKKQYDFTVENGVATTTIELDGRASTTLGFKIRKSVGSNDWAEQSEEFRINLANIVSGTIYINVANDFSSTQSLGADVVYDNKIVDVQLDYKKNQLLIETYQPVSNENTAFVLVKDGTVIEGTSVAPDGNTYVMTMPEGLTLDLVTLYQYKITFSEQKNEYYQDLGYDIGIDGVYATEKFAEEYTYTTIDKELGASWTSTSTTFKVWAPTAEAVSVNLYTSGTKGTDDLIESVEMTKGEKGVWSVAVSGDQDGVYYTYAVTVDGETVEAVDPYARTTGVNGERGMVINLDSTDPDGWDKDTNPNKVTSQTDAIIYELHVRDFSNHTSSGMTNKGKYLAFTEEGTTVPGTSVSTGIDYLEELGITHLHLLPVYDYGSVDETTCSNFNWGYDPVNYNVPEGSYSTNPYDGAIRVNEFKQMVMSLHEHDISVVMDVVYNHVYDADKFCFNNIVPGYFSRPNSNTSGCGNDTASEREMVRKYIVESVLYWTEEYHIDGFRFDLVGLLDVGTINQIVTEVHEIRPDVIFYGEGWDMDGTNREPGTEMAKQGNAPKTPGFAYFSDSFRDEVGARKEWDNSVSLGFVSGKQGMEGSVVSNYMANPWWTSNPQQVIQYVSCHDNYTMVDKLVLAKGKSKMDADVIKMNNLAAVAYLTAQGVPLIHAGEEILREKLEEDGGRCENSYNASDFVNNINWSNLTKETYADNSAYYKGLIEFRKAHDALRYSTAAEVKDNVQSYSASGNLVVMRVDGYGAGDDDIFVILNANSGAKTVPLPEGEWTININGSKAGTTSLGTATGSVNVDGISAMVLTKADEGKDEAAPVGPSEEKTIYFSNNKRWTTVYAYAWESDGNAVTGEGWPGIAMTYVETNDFGEDIYCVTLPASDVGIAGVVFHNNNGTQTVDIVPGVDGIGYYCNGEPNAEGKFEVGTYSYRAPNLGSAEDYFLIGYINGTDYVGSDYKFAEDGTVTATFAVDSYVYVVSGDNSETYMTDGYQGAVKSAVLKDTAKHTLTADKWDKLLIPGGNEVVITMVKNDDNTITLSYESTNSSVFEDQSGVQNGVTLHCWNWSFDEIADNMATIAAQGYTAIQTSPIQVMKEATNGAENTVGSHWWVYYQPVDFVITTDSGNALGTKADFENMCKAAEHYGIKVIVDVVANHLGNKTGNDLSDAIPDYLRKDAYWHDIKTNISNWNDRYNMTQYCLSGLPDLNTSNKELQGYVLDFLKECVDAGADGFRFDMAKSIETPKDDASFASDFWPTVVGGIQDYAGGDLYIYGEVLDNPQIAISAYTAYMSVTDNSWGNNLRGAVAGGTASMAAGYHKAADASNLVIWAESHDTFADNTSSAVSEANINKTWALVAARADAMGLYLARPESMTQALGVASVTGWANEEVKAVNKFHNAFVDQSETIGNSGTLSYVVRGTEGIVIVNAGGTTADVELTVAMTDGTYVDQISGETFTVADGKITGTIGETGIAVVYGTEKTSPVAKIGEDVYGTVAEAIADAESGETIVLVDNAEEAGLVLLEGITLDLNGYVLKLKNFVALEGNYVIDSVGGGLMNVPKGFLLLQPNNPNLPVWDAANEGYAFVDCDNFREMETYGPNTVKYTFLPYLDADEYALVGQGAAVSGVELKVMVTWTSANGMPAERGFVYTDDLMRQFVEAYETDRKAFTLTLTGTDAVTDLAFRVCFASESGVEYTCNVK